MSLEVLLPKYYVYYYKQSSRAKSHSLVKYRIKSGHKLF